MQRSQIFGRLRFNKLMRQLNISLKSAENIEKKLRKFQLLVEKINDANEKNQSLIVK